MGVDIYGHSHEHLHSKCSVCGYATRSKQYRIRCACNRHWTKEQLDAQLPWNKDPTWQEEIRQAKQRVAEHERSQGTQ